jgi:hypothetical protein
MSLDLAAEGKLIDIVEGGFDTGVTCLQGDGRDSTKTSRESAARVYRRAEKAFCPEAA